MNSSLYNFFKKKIIRYNLFFLSRCANCPLNTKSDISISISKGLFGSIITNIGLLMILYLIWSKVSYCFYIYSKALSFFIHFIKDIVNCLNLSIKHRLKLTNLKNLRIFFDIYKLWPKSYCFDFLIVYFNDPWLDLES